MTLLFDKFSRKPTSEKMPSDLDAAASATTDEDLSGDDARKNKNFLGTIPESKNMDKTRVKKADSAKQVRNSIRKMEAGDIQKIVSDGVPKLIKHVSVFFDNSTPVRDQKKISEGAKDKRIVLARNQPLAKSRRQLIKKKQQLNLSIDAADRRRETGYGEKVKEKPTASMPVVKKFPAKTLSVKKSPASISINEKLKIRGKKIVCFDNGDKNSSNEYVNLCRGKVDPLQEMDETIEKEEDPSKPARPSKIESSTKKTKTSKKPPIKNNGEPVNAVETPPPMVENDFEMMVVQDTVSVNVAPVEELDMGENDFQQAEDRSNSKKETEDKAKEMDGSEDEKKEFTDIRVKEGWKISSLLPFWSAANESSTTTTTTTIVRKAKKLDLEKVKNSNLTKSLHKLENFHQQAVSIKKNVFCEKSTGPNLPPPFKNSFSKTSFGSTNDKKSDKGSSSSIGSEEEKRKPLTSTTKGAKEKNEIESRANLMVRKAEPLRVQQPKMRTHSSRPTSSESTKTFKCEKAFQKCEKPPTGREIPGKLKERCPSNWSGLKSKKGSANEISKPSTADAIGSSSSKFFGDANRDPGSLWVPRNPIPMPTSQHFGGDDFENTKLEFPPKLNSILRPPTRRNSFEVRDEPATEFGGIREEEEGTQSSEGTERSLRKLNSEQTSDSDGRRKNPTDGGEGKRKQSETRSETDHKKVRLEITIDLNDPELNTSGNSFPERKDTEVAETNLKVLKCGRFEANKILKDVLNDLILDEETNADWGGIVNSRIPADVPKKDPSADSISLKAYKSSASMKRLEKYSTTTVTRVKSRPKKQKQNFESGYHARLGGSNHFNSVTSFPNNKGKKIKPDAKVRSGLTRAINQEGVVDGDLNYLFDDAAAANLKRRNSEPNSFRGFIWKQPELAIFRSNKASASSMASSMRHMNADELEDFKVWEVAPLNMTSCWEMSLYHCRRPWSVLSCSVFKGNRMSTTPGIILESLRNGGSLDMSETQFWDKDRYGSQANDSFDVEPSIDQKDIDIRNWLSALNFPMPPPSTSNDTIVDTNFLTPVPMNPANVNQVNSKRRKVFRNLNYPEEGLEKKFDNNANWDKIGDLMELIRRKSGGFVAVDRCDGTNHSQYLAIVNRESRTRFSDLVERGTPDLGALKTKSDGVQLSSKQNEEKLFQTSEEFTEVEESRFFVEDEGPPERPESESKSPATSSSNNVVRFFKGESNINIWKYLFLLSLTLFLYNFLNERQLQQ